MRTYILKIAAISLILAGGFASCRKEKTDDTSFREISINREISVPNDIVINGIKFQFCLLNEDGEPSTIFNEGENFAFYFKCTNLDTNNELVIDNGFLWNLIWSGGFCCVISQQNDTIGYPCKSIFCETIHRYYPLYGKNNSYEKIIIWSDNREGWGAMTCFYENLYRKKLPKGKYYTGFTHEFRFYEKPLNEVDRIWYDIPASFRINFEIK
jgi:hypothetical protein